MDAMRVLAGRLRPTDPWIIGLLRRALMVLGLLVGFLLAGSAFAHAADRTPPPKPEFGIKLPVRLHVQLPLPPVLPPLTGTITSVTSAATHAVDTVVRTIPPITRPDLGTVTTPVLGTVSTPPSVRPHPPTETFTATPVLAVHPDIPATTWPPAAPASNSRSPAPPANVPPVVRVIVLVPCSGQSAAVIRVPVSPPDNNTGNQPIRDATGTSSAGGCGPGGPVFGISGPLSASRSDLLSATRIQPGTGPPKWSFFDPYHHPS